MKFGLPLFPVDIQIDDIRAAIAGRADFREVHDEKNGYSSFVYFLGMAKDIFTDPEEGETEEDVLHLQLRRECRGIVFDENGKIIARRFHKFFNINEQPETVASKIDLSQEFLILEKLDGQMISPFIAKDRLCWGTKQGVTDASALVDEFVETSDANGIRYSEFCTKWIHDGYTPIFEYCNPLTPIVLSYEKEQMKLITLRNMIDGTYYPFLDMLEDAKEYGIPCVNHWDPESFELDLNNDNIDVILQKIQSRENVEGFVLRYNNGLMYKIKTNWYFSVNKALDHIKNGSERRLWSSILNEEFDDIKSHLPDDIRDPMEEFAQNLNSAIETACHEIIDLISQNMNEDRKEFSKFVDSLPSHHKKNAWEVWKYINDEEPQNILGLVRIHIVKSIQLNLSNKRKWEDNVLPLLNGIRFRPEK